MKFSIVLATINRTDDISRFLGSLDLQTYDNFELIVVDQNLDDRLAPILSSFEKKWFIKHLRSKKGLSRARNIGLAHISGDIICFPDDDCWYPKELLKHVALFFSQHPEYGGYLGRSVDAEGHTVVGRFDDVMGYTSLQNVWKRATSISIFLRKDIIDYIGFFDETLGVGTGKKYGAGEEMDYLIRAIKANFGLYYNPNLFVFHPNPIQEYDYTTLKRGFSYGCGMGRVLRKHHYSVGFIIFNFARPLGGAILSLLLFRPKKAAYHFYIFLGRIRGYLS